MSIPVALTKMKSTPEASSRSSRVPKYSNFASLKNFGLKIFRVSKNFNLTDGHGLKIHLFNFEIHTRTKKEHLQFRNFKALSALHERRFDLDFWAKHRSLVYFNNNYSPRDLGSTRVEIWVGEQGGSGRKEICKPGPPADFTFGGNEIDATSATKGKTRAK